MIIVSESESLKSESTPSLYLLEPPKSSLNLTANFSSVSLCQRTPLPPSPPLHPLSRTRHGSHSQPCTPPGYLESKRPATTITYVFHPQAMPPNSMILSAPVYAAPPQEPYYISVSMDCFTPTSYITTIRRGSWNGEIIGEFEMGMTTSKKQSTVYAWGKEYALADILDSSYWVFKTSWTWNIMDHDRSVIYWEDCGGGGMLTCFSSKDRAQGNLLAKFIPPTLPRKQGRSPELTRLEVLPLGHDFIDDIVISALVIERARTTPSIPRVPLT